MTHWLIVFFFFSCIAVLISSVISFILVQHWKNKNARLLLLLVGVAQIWSIAYALELVLPGTELKMYCIKVQYFSSVWVSVLFLGFSLSISRMPFQLDLKRYAILSLFPLTISFLVLTNDYHHLMWQNMWISENFGFKTIDFDRGIGFRMTFLIGHTIFFSGCLVMLYRLLHSGGMLRKQLISLLLGVIPPTVASVLHLFEPGVFKFIDFTPLSFSFSGIAFLWALLKYQMLNFIPAFREAIVDSISDPVIVLDLSDHILDVNHAARKVFGLKGIFPAETQLVIQLPELFQKVAQCRKEHAKNMEFSLASQTGDKFWSLTLSELKKNRKKKQLGWLIILKDITARKKAQLALKKSGWIHRKMIEASPNPVAFYTSKGETTYVNPAFTRLFGWYLHELVGKKIDFLPESNRGAIHLAKDKIHSNPEGIYSFMTQLNTKSGGILDINVNSALYPEVEDKSGSIVVNFTDITQLKKVERDLRNTKNFVRSIINSMPSMLIGVNKKGVITQWNMEAEKITGIDIQTAVGCRLLKILPEISAHMQLVDRAISSSLVEKVQKVSVVIRSKQMLADIIIYPILSGESQGAVIRIDDVSERTRIEEMMVQSEKMLSVGGLAAGMAHEINNPLAGILQNTQVIRDRLSKKFPANLKAAQDSGIDLDRLQQYLEQRDIFFMMDLVKTSGRQAARIVNNMLSFSRKSDRRKSSHNLWELLEVVVDIIGSDYDMEKNYDFKTIKIIREYQKEMVPVPCEKSEIQQVFLNILKNGAEAMLTNTDPKPTFILRCYQEHLYGVVEIEDNGPGIASDVCKRVFEPFFTTKEVGKGTGLGLSVSYFIVSENHGGTLTVASCVGKGTIFSVRLPFGHEREAL